MSQRTILITLIVSLLCLVSSLNTVWSEEKGGKWPGVDESVVEKVAKELGREARNPLINTDQGDLLLFIFLLAGAAGGFVGGYYWRMLITEKDLKFKKEPQRSL